MQETTSIELHFVNNIFALFQDACNLKFKIQPKYT